MGCTIMAMSRRRVSIDLALSGPAPGAPELVDKFVAARFITDRHSSVLDQAVMCDFLTNGHFGRHIRRMRELYATRLAALAEAVKSKLAESVQLPETEAGIMTVAWLNKDLKANAVANAAAAHEVEVTPIGVFALKKPRPEGLLLGFAPYNVRQIREAVDRLALALKGYSVKS